MDKALLDTDIFSEVLKGKDPQVAARAAEYTATLGRLAISTVTVMEIVKGLHHARKSGRLERFLRTLSSADVFEFDAEHAILAGQIYADLERTGQPVGRADPMIAAIAIRQDRTLIPGNTEHFERIRSLGYPLRLADWRSAPEGDPKT